MFRSEVSTPCKVSNAPVSSEGHTPKYRNSTVKRSFVLPSLGAFDVSCLSPNNTTATSDIIYPSSRSTKSPMKNLTNSMRYYNKSSNTLHKSSSTSTPMKKDIFSSCTTNPVDAFAYCTDKTKTSFSTIKKKAKLSPVRYLEKHKHHKKVNPLYMPLSERKPSRRRSSSGSTTSGSNHKSISFEEMLARCCNGKETQDYHQRRINSYESMEQQPHTQKYELESFMLNRAVTQHQQKYPTTDTQPMHYSKNKNSVKKESATPSIAPELLNAIDAMTSIPSASSSFIVEDNSNDYMLRTSELEPSPFQIEIPTFDEFIHQVHICTYASKRDATSASDEKAIYPRKISFSNCDKAGFGHDVILEDIIRVKQPSSSSGKKDAWMEVLIFNVQHQNRIVLCYQASPELQAKPVRNRTFLQNLHSTSSNTTNGTNTDSTAMESHHDLYPPFQKAYKQKNTQTKIFQILNQKLKINPFNDVVFTGYSFGAALATIASTRFATLHPSIRVSCHVFASPKVGCIRFKNHAHSLPNLKIFRLEYGLDPYVHLPDSNGSGCEYIPVGHVITLSPTSTTHTNQKDASNNTDDSNTNKNPIIQARAYKFNKHRDAQTHHPNIATTTNHAHHQSTTSFFKSPFKSKKTYVSSNATIANTTYIKAHHELRFYFQSLEMLSSELVQEDSLSEHKRILKDFVGEDYGTGVNGIGNEKRYIV